MTQRCRRAVWIDLKHLREPREVTAFVDWCGHAGIDLAFPCVNHVSGYMTYASDLAPRAAEVDRWDPTAEMLAQCRRAGIETHVWVCIGNWGKAVIDPARLSARGPRPLQETHPEWFCTNQHGISTLASGSDYAFLNPAHPEVRAFHVRLCEEILGRYAFDGYHLDYIRYHFGSVVPAGRAKEAYAGEADGLAVPLAGTERLSFDEATLRAFDADTGTGFFQAGPDLTSRVRWLYAADGGGARREAWYAWKAAQVTRMVEDIRAATRRSARQLSAAVFAGYPWCGQEVAQRWPEWVDRRLLDLAVPMDYGIPLDRYPAHLRSQTDAMRVRPAPAVPMLSGVYSKDIFDALPPGGAADLLGQFEAEARRQGRLGMSLYSYESFRRLL